MHLTESKVAIRVMPKGFLLRMPPNFEALQTAKLLSKSRGEIVDGQVSVTVQQEFVDGELVDSEDRIQIGASLLRDLAEAGY